MLSYCEKPYEGELLYGFALRMYRHNEEPESFRRFAFRNFGIGYGTGRGTKILYDYVTDAERAAAENIRLRSFPDIRRLVFEMLPTGAILPFHDVFPIRPGIWKPSCTAPIISSGP